MCPVSCDEQPGLGLSEEMSAVKSHQHGPGHGGGLTSRVPALGLTPVQARQTHLEGKKANKGSWAVEGAGDAWPHKRLTQTCL